jgi:hypothetical protein
LVLVMSGFLAGCGGGGGADAQAGAAGGAQGLPAGTVPLYRIYERSITNSGSYGNKFTDVELTAHYTSPSGREITLPGFYDGDGRGGQHGDVWKIRFMPDELGQWRYRYEWSDGTPGGEGTFSAVGIAAGKGILKAYRANPHWFAWNGTDPVFLKSYHVPAAGFTGLPVGWAAANVYAKLAARGYNHVMLKALPIAWTDEVPANAPGDYLARPLWSATPREQDLEVWRRFEEHMRWLNERDIGVFFFMGFDPKSTGSPDAFFAGKRWSELSAEDQEMYVRYVVARLAPFANIAGWNYTWETDGSGGEERLMDLIARYDPWDHLATYHDEAPASNRYDSDKYSFAGIENHGYFGNGNGAPALDSASHYQATRDAYRGKPVYMVEGNGLWRNCWAKDAASASITRAAWAVTLAGGSFTWSDLPGCNDGATWDLLAWPAGAPVADRLEVLYRIMTQELAFERMKPANELLSGCASSFNRSGPVPSAPCYALAEPGAQYAVYKEGGGSFALQLAAGTYNAAWYDTRAGRAQPVGAAVVQGGGSVGFSAPSTSSDWVLVLKRAG